MPLDPAVAVDQVRRIVDPSHAAHSWPSSAQDARARWAAAVRAYLNDLAAPVTVPGTLDAAAAAMAAAFDPSAGLAGLEAGLVAFAAAVVAGAAPGVVATAPPAPPAFGDMAPTSDGTTRAAQVAAALDAWARTGLTGATPGPATIPWS